MDNETKTDRVTIKAIPNLGGVMFHAELMTVEEYKELKYGTGEAEVSRECADWLIAKGHAQIKEGA